MFNMWFSKSREQSNWKKSILESHALVTNVLKILVMQCITKTSKSNIFVHSNKSLKLSIRIHDHLEYLVLILKPGYANVIWICINATVNWVVTDSVIASRIILCMRTANERWRYIVRSSLIGWAHAQKYIWACRLFGTKPLSKAKMFGQMNPFEQASGEFEFKYKRFISKRFV